MSRSIMIGAAAFAALLSNPIATAVAQVDRDADIVVAGPRARIMEESGSMFNVYKASASSTVYYGDLDLRTMAGRDALKYRVRLAAMKICNQLDRAHSMNIALSEPGACMADAVTNARPQLNRAVALYGG